MAKAQPTTNHRVVRDPETGRVVTLCGEGALGPLRLLKGIDLTKPIAEQASKLAKRPNGFADPIKR